ncbi:MAG TPA: nucleotide exchange factor GrpE [Candidatus Dormibacteraeota bacterium]|nr:nucleotide exchange factor GrpE [Candidatus Dormibacteraeota bacterium]
MGELRDDSVATDEVEKEDNEQEILEKTDEEADMKEVSEDHMLEMLKEELEQIKKERDEAADRTLRVQAEFENFKKRTQRERIAERTYKSQDLVNELLPALDNFERALAVEPTEETKSILEGITMVYNQLNDALKTENVEVIETVGKEFDPNLHHAVMQVEDENYESNIVIEELQKGYILKERVIRPAMVKVNK